MQGQAEPRQGRELRGGEEMSVMSDAADMPNKIRAEKIPWVCDAIRKTSQPPGSSLCWLTAEEHRILFPPPPRKAFGPQILVSREGTAPVFVV